MAYRITERQIQILEALASGATDRDACRRLRLSASQLQHEWAALGKKLEKGAPGTIEEYQIVVQYEKVTRRRLEAELWASEARLNALMDISPEAILVVDGRSGRVLKANNRALTLFGYSPREIQGIRVERLIEPRLQARHSLLRVGFLNSVRKREMGYHPPILGVAKDGSSMELDIALTATSATDDVMVACRRLDVAMEPTARALAYDADEGPHVL